MFKVLGLMPLFGNGGIKTWGDHYRSYFPHSEFELISVNNAPDRKNMNYGVARRIITGLIALQKIIIDVKSAIIKNTPDILHTTTSGSLGTFRDYKIAKLCKKHNIKSIMHCHYGSVANDVASKSLLGFWLRKTMNLYDQIWVLDSKSYNVLQSIPYLKDKVHLTPNAIKTSGTKPVLTPKEFRRIGFVGNLIPSKGLFELVEACADLDVTLDIIGPGTTDVITKIKAIAGAKIDSSIFIHGRLPNADALELMKTLDIIALPTYYIPEAFPISILEAMSLGKLIISCDRGAIQDMLTDLDGQKCGILVAPKSSASIKEAIEWTHSHRDEADNMCRKAYESVNNKYSTDIVYEMYLDNYRMLFGNTL